MTIAKELKMKRNLPIKGILVSILGLGLISLIGYNMHDRILGAPLNLEIAPNGSTIDSQQLAISGSAPHARELLINGRPINIDRNGAFSDKVLLSPGYNVVEIAVKDQFGKEKIKTYQYAAVFPQTVIALKDSFYNKNEEQPIINDKKPEDTLVVENPLTSNQNIKETNKKIDKKIEAQALNSLKEDPVSD